MSSEIEGDYAKLKVNELKAELKKRGLSTEGKKQELLERLTTHLGDSALLDDSQDELLDDDADLSDEVLDESAIDNSPSDPAKPNLLKRPIEDEEKRHPKKIILNRKTIDAPDPEPEPVAEEKAPVTPAQVVKEVKKDSPLDKCHILTPQQRLEKRASRFGVTGSETPKPETPTAAKPITVAKTGVVSSTDLEVLKKRAERFGAIAPALEKAKIEEKKMDRLKRFGTSTLATSVGVGGDDKKAHRAARFAS